MNHREMIAQKTVQFSMAEIKELNYCLEHTVSATQQEADQAKEMSHKDVLQDKVDFLKKIKHKLND